jgi:hypothetical protein
MLLLMQSQRQNCVCVLYSVHKHTVVHNVCCSHPPAYRGRYSYGASCLYCCVNGERSTYFNAYKYAPKTSAYIYPCIYSIAHVFILIDLRATRVGPV